MKPPLTIDQQIDLLKNRGMRIESVDKAKRALLDTGYYRLSGYFRQFQVDPVNRQNDFEPNTSMDLVLDIVDLDRRTSITLLDGLLELEKVVRARFVNQVTNLLGEEVHYLDPDFYMTVMRTRGDFVEKLYHSLVNAKSRAILRYQRGSDLSNLPIWVAVQHLSFGTLSLILEYMGNEKVRHGLAESFSFRRETFTSTIHSLAVFRNACAHQEQLWHRPMVKQAPKIKKAQKNWTAHHPQSYMSGIVALVTLLEAVDRDCQRAAEIRRMVNDHAADYQDGICRPIRK